MSLGSKFKELREELGLPREELAIKFGISYSTLLKYEFNKMIPDEETLNMFADFFDVSAHYLLGNTNVRKVDYSLLSSDDKKEIIDVLERTRYELENPDEGEPLCQEAIDSLIEALKIGLPMALIQSKQSLCKKELQD